MPIQIASETMLSVEEVAERIGKTTRTVQRWCDRGSIFEGARKDGPFGNSKWLVPETAVLAYEAKYGVGRL